MEVILFYVRGEEIRNATVKSTFLWAIKALQIYPKH